MFEKLKNISMFLKHFQYILWLAVDWFWSNRVFCSRLGGIPAKHKDEKLLIFLGIIDILQSYRYESPNKYQNNYYFIKDDLQFEHWTCLSSIQIYKEGWALMEGSCAWWRMYFSFFH